MTLGQLEAMRATARALAAPVSAPRRSNVAKAARPMSGHSRQLRAYAVTSPRMIPHAAWHPMQHDIPHLAEVTIRNAIEQRVRVGGRVAAGIGWVGD